MQKQPFGDMFPMPDDSALQGGIVALLGVVLGTALSEVNKPATTQANPYRSSNPYRNQTVADIEQAFLVKPPSPKREAVLRELAKYSPEMQIAEIPTAIALLNAR